MKRKILIFAIVVLTLGMLLTACGEEKTVSSISVVEGSFTAECEVGQTLDFSALEAVVTYSDGTTETIGSDKLTVGKANTSEAGEIEVSVSYEGVRTKIAITVVEPEVNGGENVEIVYIVGIEIDESTVGKTCMKGDVFDTKGIKAKAIFSDGTSEDIAERDLKVEALDTSEIGEAKLTATYLGIADSVTVNVVDVVNANVVKDSVKSLILEDEVFDTSKLQLAVTYTDGSTAVIDRSQLKITTPDKTKFGSQIIEISYFDFKLEYELYVNGIIGIELDVDSVPNAVVLGGTIETKNTKVIATYYNGDTKEFDMESKRFTVTCASTLEVGETTVTVKFGAFSDEKTVAVLGVKSMSVDESAKNEIMVGEAYTAKTLPVNVIYTDNSTAKLDLPYTRTVDTSVVGANYLLVSYLDCTIQYAVRVIGVKTIEISDLSAIEHQVGIPFLAKELKVNVIYTNNKSDQLLLAFEGNVDYTKVGEYPLTVKLLDKTLTVNFKVYGVEGIELEMDGNDLETLAVYVVYGRSVNNRIKVMKYSSNIETLNFEDDVDDVIIVSYVDEYAKAHTATLTVAASALE